MNKFLRILYLAPLSFLMTGCWTSIWTVAPTERSIAPVRTEYTTRVTTPAPKHTTTTTVYVTSYNEDLSFYLDLNAVAAAFAEARTVPEFEQLLNSSRYMINNLDLNRDGYIDYLRVLETRQGAYHAFLIQACLGPSLFQDVATLVAERRASTLYVEVVGDRYLYGANYIVRPVFVKRPPLWDVFGRPTYAVWSSPYYYGAWPSYYAQPKPIYLTHYQAYVTTYMSHHHYCHTCEYPSKPFYPGYTTMTQTSSRRDYQTAHPEQSFDKRVVETINASSNATPSSRGVRNSGQLRVAVAAEKTPAETTKTGSTTTTSTTSSSRNSGTSGSSGSTRTTGTTTATKTSSSSSRTPSTSVESRVSKNGTTRTTIKTTDSTGKTTTVKRTSSSSTRTSTSSSRTTGSSRTSGTSGSSRTTGSSSSRR